ncbi:hypothetical protein [Psychroserpens sp. Hel_I_66]|uniref:hypothetical protein n=1 Tax=Psychroserpens sp. Hel_I_66 TaxID=1250004 RepID=UPI00064672DE|nr:hypothetical protein [Psychroserpens sp. Hel_I_66]
MPSRNTLTLLSSGLIVVAFLVFGILDILDYVIVKIILFSSFAVLAFYLISIVLKDPETD